MTASQHAFLRILRHVCDIALKFTGRAHINQRFSRFALRERFVGKGADLLIETLFRNRIISRWLLARWTKRIEILG